MQPAHRDRLGVKDEGAGDPSFMQPASHAAKRGPAPEEAAAVSAAGAASSFAVRLLHHEHSLPRDGRENVYVQDILLVLRQLMIALLLFWLSEVHGMRALGGHRLLLDPGLKTRRPRKRREILPRGLRSGPLLVAGAASHLTSSSR